MLNVFFFSIFFFFFFFFGKFGELNKRDTPIGGLYLTFPEPNYREGDEGGEKPGSHGRIRKLEMKPPIGSLCAESLCHKSKEKRLKKKGLVR